MWRRRWPSWSPAARVDGGIVIDGAGIGSAIAANKIRGVRAVMAPNETIARYAREHNGANVLTLGRPGHPRRGAGDRHDLADDADAGAALHPGCQRFALEDADCTL
jgi:hypothetical protein